MKMELRVANTKLVANEDGSLKVSGYVNKTGEYSEILGVTKRFKEKIAKGTFSRAIRNSAIDIDFLAEHNNKQILASTRNGSLELTEDEQGLFMSANITPTSWGRDYYELINSGILRNMSFGFRTIKDSWRMIESNLYERTIEELELFEVSVVKNPAYSQSTIAARSIEIIEEPEIHIQEETEEEQEVDLDLRSAELRLSIMKSEDTVRSMESMKKHLSDNTSLLFVLEREKQRLDGLKSELEDIKNQMEEVKMTKQTEERDLQGTTEGQSTVSQQVASIAELLESSSDVVANARKIELIGANMKIPYETSLDDAAFVLDGEKIPKIKLNLDGQNTLTGKRVGEMIDISQVFINESKGLGEHSKKLLVRRVGKKIEEEILTGDNVKGLKGIALDTLVPSVTLASTPTEAMLRALYLKVNSEYRPYCKWYMSEAYFEKIARITVNGEYLVKSKTVDGKVIPTLWEHEIQICTAMQDGDAIAHTPIIFASISDCYTLAVAKDIEIEQVIGMEQALGGFVSFKAEALLDGCCHSYQSVAKGVLA
jgi:HK97 family phage prohead protease/HK97 family phage major capsid protein